MPIRDQLPASLQLVMQNGLLERTFQDALVPEFLYPTAGTNRPWSGNMGDTAIFTRPGLLSPVTTSLNGSDPADAPNSAEQYSMTMADYGNSKDTDLLASAMALSSLFLDNVQKLGINAGQSLNLIARNRLYNAYNGGRTWVTTAQGTATTTAVVNDVTGFEQVVSPTTGKLVAVSGSTPLSVTVAGVANTVVAVDAGTNTLTLGTAVTQTVGAAVVSVNAAFTKIAGAGNDTPYDLGANDQVTFKDFRAAVTRLRRMNVPGVGGYYVAHINSETESQLFDDAEFKSLHQGRGDSPVYQNLSLGRFGGIDWVRNEEAPTLTLPSGVVVQQPIVVGQGALLNGPFDGYIQALNAINNNSADIREIGENAEGTTGMSVALITRMPQDKMQRKVTSSWGWVGDFATPSDVTTGDDALYKRAVVVSHA